jgi:hypothetical protein
MRRTIWASLLVFCLSITLSAAEGRDLQSVVTWALAEGKTVTFTGAIAEKLGLGNGAGLPQTKMIIVERGNRPKLVVYVTEVDGRRYLLFNWNTVLRRVFWRVNINGLAEAAASINFPTAQSQTGPLRAEARTVDPEALEETLSYLEMHVPPQYRQ